MNIERIKGCFFTTLSKMGSEILKDERIREIGTDLTKWRGIENKRKLISEAY